MAVDNDQDNEEILSDELNQTEDESEENSQESEAEENLDDDSDVVVTIGEEAPPTEEEEHAKAPEWVKDLRKSHREQARRIKELEAQAEVKQQPKPVDLGQKPTLESCDYDEDKFETELTSWHERKRKVDEQAAQEEGKKKSEQESWNKKLENYGKAKTELKVKDFDEAEAAVLEHLDTTKQGIIVKVAKNPALVVFALGKNEKKLKELSSITDPVEFTYELALLEIQLKVTRKIPPEPEKTVSKTRTGSGSVDSTLQRLRAEAEKTGNYSKVAAYNREKRKR